MTLQLTLAVSLALLLLYLLAVWSRRGSADDAHGDFEQDIGSTIAQALLELPPQALALRIFDPEDWKFVLSSGGCEAKGVFLAERKRVALIWLRQTKRTVAKILRLYRQAASGSKNIRLWTELSLAFDYFLFLLLCQLLSALIWLRGPFLARQLIGTTTNLAEQLSYAAGQIVGGPGRLGLANFDSSEKGA